ncbi:hypothetical protein RINTHM_6410 [Richelia intracellularis HM01]|nr:hypothetical protein RINTHM_6410 [Richelia intracellularis HM01]
MKGTRREGRKEAAIAIPIRLHYDPRRAYCKFYRFFANSQDF